MNIFSNKNNVITYTVNKESISDLYISVQNGEVVISAPWYMASNQIQKIVEEKTQWIINKINEYEENCKNKNQYTKLKKVKVLGNDYDLSVKYKGIKNSCLNIENNQIKVILPNKFKKIGNTEILNMLIEKMYKTIAKNEIERIMEKTRIITGYAPEDYKIEIMNNVIAKCNDKIIKINPQISMYSKDVIEYVILHEFCHLKYKNHTKSFYKMLSTYMPNYEKYIDKVKNI